MEKFKRVIERILALELFLLFGSPFFGLILIIISRFFTVDGLDLLLWPFAFFVSLPALIALGPTIIVYVVILQKTSSKKEDNIVSEKKKKSQRLERIAVIIIACVLLPLSLGTALQILRYLLG